MHKLFLQCSFLILTLFMLSNTIQSQTKLLYTVSMPKPSNHLFEIEIEVQNASSDSFTEFIIPAWRSGRYLIFNFATGIQEFSAVNLSGDEIKWHKTDKQTWRVENSGQSSFKIKYKMYANEFSNRTKGLNDELAFIDPSAVLMYCEKFRHNPLEVKINPFGSWHVTTGLDSKPGSENMFTSPDYDWLADCPIIAGNQKDYDFTVAGKKHTVTFTGEGTYNPETVIKDLSKITEENIKFWGELPYEHYNFIFQLTTQASGGTEHINSYVIDASPFLFANNDSYQSFLSTCSHEFFHTWNVKQLRPKGLTPYDFTKENYTEELWIAEGTTSYYQDIMLIKAGYKNASSYLKTIQNNIQNDIDRPGNKIQSLAESSFDAWVKFWVNTPNKWNSESDYYSKGANVSLLLDLEIRHSSKNKYSLDNVMRAMFERFPLKSGGYTNADFIKVCEEFAGESLTDFFNSYLYGVVPLDWEKYLSYAGLNLKKTEGQIKPAIGVSTRDSEGRLVISNIKPESPAYDAGLNSDDEIVAMNGYKVNGTQLTNRIGNMKEGDMITITVMRSEKIQDIKVTVKNLQSTDYTVEKINEPSELQKKIYERWLNIQ